MGLDVLKKWKPVFSQSTFLLTDILHQLGWWLVLGLKYLAEEFVKVAKSYKGDSKGYRVLIESPDPDRWMIKESEVLPLQTAKFEGVEVKLPAKNHDILTRQYGNYWSKKYQG